MCPTEVNLPPIAEESAHLQDKKKDPGPWSAFNFENVERNRRLEIRVKESNIQAFSHLKTKKTGTTIVGAIFCEGVVLGADTRATSGSIVADKNCEKIHFMAPNIMCCGAGTAADTEKVTSLVSSRLTLQRLSTGKQSRLTTCYNKLSNHLFKFQGHISAALVLGGCDVFGPSLGTVAPHGSTDKLPFVAWVPALSRPWPI